MQRFFFSLAFFTTLSLSCFATYYSQYEQDKFANENFFHNKRNGVFVDIGAHNGVKLSNTYFYEKELGWTGICVEPIPDVYAELKQNRRCICVQGCVSNSSGQKTFLKVPNNPTVERRVLPGCTDLYCSQDYVSMLSGLKDTYHPQHLERMQREIAEFGGSCEEITVQCYTLNELLEKNDINHVDFLSIDIEGGEFDILAAIDFGKYQIDVITVEDNYGDQRFIPFLTEKGYRFVGRLATDLVFEKNAKVWGGN